MLRQPGRARRAFASLRRRFPLTVRGVGVLALAAAGLWFFGYAEADLVLLAVGWIAIGLVTLSALLVMGAAFALRRVSAAPAEAGTGLEAPRRLETGNWWRTGRTVPDWFALPWVQVSVGWERPEGAHSRLVAVDGRLAEELQPRRRWREAEAVRHWTVRDAFGLSAFTITERAPLAVWALPAVGRLRETPIVTANTGADGIPWPTGAPEGDRMDIRRYAAGDSARDVMWNVFARTRRLHVRLRERAVDPSRRLVAYLVAGPGDEATAAAARVALESGVLGESWAFGADGSEGVHRELESALEAVARSGSHAGSCALAAFLDAVDFSAETACVVFVPPELGSWVAEVAPILADRAGRISVVVGVDRLRVPRPRAPLWRRLLFESAPEAREGVLAEEVDEVARTLAPNAAGPPVVVVRSTGQSHGYGEATPSAARKDAA